MTNTHDSLNRLTRKSSAPSVLSAGNLTFDYAYNSANQRITVTNADASRWDYGYDPLGQLTNGVRSWAEGGPVPGQQFAYGFDDIGNRKWTRTGGDSSGAGLRLASYTNNLLNQITSREVPGYVEVQGSASNAATVTVNLQPTYRRDEFYRAELAVTNGAALVWQGVTNIAVLQFPGGDMITTNKGNVLVPKTPQVMQYDLDGNLTNDGVWSYRWDDGDRPRANRLKNMSGLSALPTAARQSLNFRYDYSARRILKVVSNWTGSAWAGAYTNKFLYDGWNLVAEVNHTNAVMRSYTWGTDASGTMQGAGGVGGLLAMTVHLGTNAGTYFYAYDGNHNVAGLVNAATGEWAARYEYGPFGELLRASGPLALENPFLFSTKYLDWESGLYYYGYRFYDPSTGRWLSRDPIAEAGGVNLYGFVGNGPTGSFDPLGLELWMAFQPIPSAEEQAKSLEKGRQWFFDQIVSAGDVKAGLPRKLLHRWLWKEGDYQLSDEEFRTHVWGPYQEYRGHNYENGLSLRSNAEFAKDVRRKCGIEKKSDFEGTYLFPTYARFGRTLGNYSLIVKVRVLCVCDSRGTVDGFQAIGTVSAKDIYNFDAGARPLINEASVLTMRWLHNVTSYGQDFTITTKNYPVEEIWVHGLTSSLKIKW